MSEKKVKGVVNINIKYSIDKLKLEFQYIRIGEVNKFLKSVELINGYNYNTSNAVTKCQHNFYFGEKGSEGVVYVGVVPNWKAEDKYDKSIVLEYNPNKVDPFLIKELSWLKELPVATIRLMSFDIACDIPIDYKYVRMLKRDKREKFAIFGSDDVETRYLGDIKRNGHIKLYNKAKQLKLDNMDWTRFEITINKINALGCSQEHFEKLVKVPSLYNINCQYDLQYQQLNDITRLAFESIIDDTTRLYSMKRYETRKKFINLMNELLEPIYLDKKEMYECYLMIADIFKKEFDTKYLDVKAIMQDNL